MNPAKSEVKILVAEEIGRKIEGMAEGAIKKTHLQQGAKEGLEHAARRVSELAAHVDKELQEGILDGFVGEPLKVAEYAKRYLKRAVGVLDNLATTAEVSRLTAVGMEKGLREAAVYVSGVWNGEKSKLEAFAKALEDGEFQIEEPPSGHPGPSLKSQRKAEEDAKQGTPPEEPPPPEEPKATEEPRKQAPKKRLRQPKKKR